MGDLSFVVCIQGNKRRDEEGGRERLHSLIPFKMPNYCGPPPLKSVSNEAKQ